MVNEVIESESLGGVVVPVVLNRKDLSKVAESERAAMPKYWDREFVVERLSLVPAGSHKMLFVFLWMSGCRITEALSIRKRDVDFRNYTVKLRWLKSRKYLTRVAPLHPQLKDLLEVYSSSMGLDDVLFPMSRQRALQLVNKFFGGSPHMFRHSFAVNWLRQGGRLEVLSRALGHADIRHTMVYLSIVPQDVGKELMKLRFD